MKSFWNFLKKNKLYAAVNVTGLSISMAFVLILAVYIQRQLSTDAFQENADRIYAVGNEEFNATGYWMQRLLTARYPEIEAGASVCDLGSYSFTITGETVYASTLAADSSFFDIFSYELTEGDREEWKVSEDRCMVSEAFAKAHFGGESPIDKVITMDEKLPLTICGVYEDFGNSVIESRDVLVRGEVMPKLNSSHNEQMHNAVAGICFIMVRKGADMMAKQADLLSYMKERYWLYKAHDLQQVTLVPLRKLYFPQGSAYDPTDTLRTGSRPLVNLLISLCAMLLLFAVLNYVNMTTALTCFRAKEMATRQLVGATKAEVFLKSIAESTLLCAVAMVVAVLIAEALSPAASTLLSYHLSIFEAAAPGDILIVATFVLVVGILAGLVPALTVRQVEPIEIVRGTLRRKTKTLYGKITIVLQNAVAVAMLVIALTMTLQIRSMITADLGYNTKDILVIENNFGDYGDITSLLDAFRAEAFVEKVGLGNGIPLEGTDNLTTEMGNGNWVSFQKIVGDDGYFDILGLRQKQDNHSDGNDWWLNEYAFKAIGIDEDAPGFTSTTAGHFSIGGIYHDFKVKPLLDDQSAALIRNKGEYALDAYPWTIIVKVTGDHGEAYGKIEADTKALFPAEDFEADFYDDLIAQGFADESRVSKIILIFTILAIFVSALGLFAMSAYYMQQERKSAAVKKVFGAEYGEVLRELVFSFLGLVAIAFIVAVPVSYVLMHRWLSTFSHHIGLSWWFFLAACVVAGLIAAASVLYQSVKTASANPATELKKE